MRNPGCPQDVLESKCDLYSLSVCSVIQTLTFWQQADVGRNFMCKFRETARLDSQRANVLLRPHGNSVKFVLQVRNLRGLDYCFHFFAEV
jgi:hypothetical protein